ncbi:hypothetical protein [Roseovarius nanhaiticus]|uniref:hypothetical protein n=1 Tax=Roseovarius nanhaiticus TaxID=573024 RepID=UPI0011142631|nr:hypothetical protein [Roseovarius nanhaiticus]
MKLQEKILQRIEDHKYEWISFQTFWRGSHGFTIEETPDWTDNEAFNIRILIEDGLLQIEDDKDGPWLGDGFADPYAANHIRITGDGHRWLESRSWFRRIGLNIASNVPTIFVSVVIALISAGLLKLLGLTE